MTVRELIIKLLDMPLGAKIMVDDLEEIRQIDYVGVVDSSEIPNTEVEISLCR